MIRALVLASVISASAAGAEDVTALATASQEAHGLRAWWEVEVVELTLDLTYGGNAIFEGARFQFEAHGPRARYESGGATVVFDGTTTWATPAEAATPRARFHVLTWPWFWLAPFKTMGEGITLDDPHPIEMDGVTYASVLQTFADHHGDTPDDWYRLLYHPDTNELDAMIYIVTFGRSAEDANASQSMITYHDVEETDGVRVASAFKLWSWDAASGSRSESISGEGRVSNVVLRSARAGDFDVPEGAVEIGLPETE